MTTAVQPTALHAYVLDPLERAVSTFVQQWVILITPLLVLVNVNGHQQLGVSLNAIITASDMSGFAAIVSLITSIISFRVPKLPPAADLVVRVAKTYLQSFVASITLATFLPSILHADWKVALVGAVPVASLALLKGLATLAAPWSDGASLIPLRASLYKHSISPVHPAAVQAAVLLADSQDPHWEGLDSAKASSPEPLPQAPNLGKHEAQ